MSSTGALRKLAALPWRDRRLLVQAVAWTGIMRAAILLLKFSRVSAFLGLERGESQASVDAAAAAEAGRVGWAVRAAAARVPWQAACLVQAATGAYLLRRRRLPSTLYLGVAKDASIAEGIAAHAWLRCGNAILTGDGGRERFRQIAALTPRLGP